MRNQQQSAMNLLFWRAFSDLGVALRFLFSYKFNQLLCGAYTCSVSTSSKFYILVLLRLHNRQFKFQHVFLWTFRPLELWLCFCFFGIFWNCIWNVVYYHCYRLVVIIDKPILLHQISVRTLVAPSGFPLCLHALSLIVWFWCADCILITLWCGVLALCFLSPRALFPSLRASGSSPPTWTARPSAGSPLKQANHLAMHL